MNDKVTPVTGLRTRYVPVVIEANERIGIAPAHTDATAPAVGAGGAGGFLRSLALVLGLVRDIAIIAFVVVVLVTCYKLLGAAHDLSVLVDAIVGQMRGLGD